MSTDFPSLPFDLPDFEPGWIWLVGAGPGDPGLLTLLAAHALRLADVVVYDALVDTRVLALAANADHEFAGKRAGAASPTQTAISERLAELAREGKRVVRLKGGDPFVFGRGGEEALHLVAEDIPYRIVPGISAGVGGLAYAGIPLTHRDINSSVTFVSGRMAGGQIPNDVNWQSLAREAPVIVVYMGLLRLQRIAARLIEGGRDPKAPVAIISRATMADQTVLETTLEMCAIDAAGADMAPPALMVIGEVVRLHPVLNWFRPLSQTLMGAAPAPLAGAPEEADPWDEEFWNTEF